jgi:hypothetical protein
MMRERGVAPRSTGDAVHLMKERAAEISSARPDR